MRQCRSIALFVCVVLGFLSAEMLSAEVPDVVFVVRDGEASTPRTSADLRPAAEPSSTWSQLRVLRSDGTERVLLENRTDPPSLPTDFADPDVSYDGERVVFSGYLQEESAWRLFEIGVDGEGFRQVTHSDRKLDLKPFGDAGKLFTTYDDLDPCFLPDGRICFSSTRYPGVAPDLRGRTTNLYVVESDGTALHRITTERYGADTPTVDPTTGQIVYSRWWRSIPHAPRRVPGKAVPEVVTIPPGGYYHQPPPRPPIVARDAVTGLDPADFLGLNSWFLSSINPDGTDLAMHSGFHFNRELTQAWRPSVLSDGSVAALFVTETPFSGLPHEKGLRVFEGGIQRPDDLGGPNTFQDARVNDYVYSSVAALPDGKLLVSAARAETPNDFDLYIQTADRGSTPQKLGGSPFQDLDAVPIVVRELPPVIADRIAPTTTDEVYMSVEEAFEKGGSFQFIVENIFANAPVDVDLPSAPPLGKNLTIEFYMAPQRESVGPRDLPILIAERRIPPSGRVAIDLPADVPLFEVLRTPDGKFAQGRDLQVYHVGGQNFGHAGTVARCVGCHTGHSTMAVPEDPSVTNIAPSAELEVSGTRRGPTATESWRPENLVDRDTASSVGEWGSLRDDRNKHWFSLSWGERVEAEELVLHSGDPGIQSAEIFFFATRVRSGTVGREVAPLDVEGPLDPTGTRIAIPRGSSVSVTARFA